MNLYIGNVLFWLTFIIKLRFLSITDKLPLTIPHSNSLPLPGCQVAGKVDHDLSGPKLLLLHEGKVKGSGNLKSRDQLTSSTSKDGCVSLHFSGEPLVVRGIKTKLYHLKNRLYVNLSESTFHSVLCSSLVPWLHDFFSYVKVITGPGI